MIAAFDPLLTNITLAFPHKQPTSEEILCGWARDREQYAPGQAFPKFTALELAYARTELNPTAIWDSNNRLEVRVEG